MTIDVGVLGATGTVGQLIIANLANHPDFNVNYVAASENTARDNPSYENAVRGRWYAFGDIPNRVRGLKVHDARYIESALGQCKIVFSSIEMPTKKELQELEMQYARAGFPVFSNASAHRGTPDVPMLIPEINAKHLKVIPYQQEHYEFNSGGFIVVKPNCSLQSYLAPVYALMKAGHKVSAVDVTTLQACSGAGEKGFQALERTTIGMQLYDMIQSGSFDLERARSLVRRVQTEGLMDICDNVIPYIAGEEEKTEKEPMKILGEIVDGEIVDGEIADYSGMKISAQCTRVPVMDGHMACVKLRFSSDSKPTIKDIIDIWRRFKGPPQDYGLYSAPAHPIIYMEEVDRPQTKLDRWAERGMAVTVGRLEKCNVMDVKFTGLSHNTQRGAALGNILNAELAHREGYF